MGAGHWYLRRVAVHEAFNWHSIMAGLVPAIHVCAPGMGIDLEVRVLSRAGHSEQSEPQSVAPRGRREGSGERNCGPTNRNRIRGEAEQGERADCREALVTKAQQRKSGGRAVKVDVLTRGDLALCPKGRRWSQDQRSEKSAEAVVAARAAKGRTMGRAKRLRTSGTHVTEVG